METEKSTVDVKKQGAEQNLPTERMKTGKVFLPHVDIVEDKDSIIITADMAGVGEGEANVTLENDVLTIEGTVGPGDWGTRRLAYTEYDIGDYFRSFIINEAVDRERIQATIKDGVLRIVLPKAEASKPKHIPIRAE
jgi:HSP20 family protein